MYSFYGGKQGKTYNIVKRFDEIYFNADDYSVYDSTKEYSQGEYFSYTRDGGTTYDVYIVTTEGSYNDGEYQGIIINMPDDAEGENPKVYKLQGMVNEFRKGGSYNQVNYGEYVIIDTVLNQNHKSDDINGCLYRRGFDFTEEPAFNSRPDDHQTEERTFNYKYRNPLYSENQENDDQPQFIQDTYTKQVPLYYQVYVKIGEDQYSIDNNLAVLETDQQGEPIRDETTGQFIPVTENGRFLQEKWNSDLRRYKEFPGGGAIYIGQITGPQGDSPKLFLETWDQYLIDVGSSVAWQPHETLTSLGDFPGLYHTGSEGEGTLTYHFNDNIQAAYYNLKDKDGNFTGAVLSFRFPRTVFRVSGQTINTFGSTPSTHINIEGVPDTFTYNGTYNSTTGQVEYDNLIHRHSSSDNHHYYEDLQIAIPKGIKGQSFEEIGIEPNENDNNYKWYYYKKRNYETEAEGVESDSIYIAPYKVIDNIEPVFPQSTVEVVDPEDDEQTVIQTETIDNASAAAMKISYTYGEDTYFPLKQINSISVASSVENDYDNYILRANYSNGGTGTTEEQVVGNIQIDTVKDLKVVGNLILIKYSIPTNHTGTPTTTYDDSEWFIFDPLAVGYKIGSQFSSIEELQQEFPNGFKGDYGGWTAIAPSTVDSNLNALFAYNYSKRDLDPEYPSEAQAQGWKEIYRFESNVDPNLFIRFQNQQSDESLIENNDSLSTNGIIFITSNTHSHQ